MILKDVKKYKNFALMRISETLREKNFVIAVFPNEFLRNILKIHGFFEGHNHISPHSFLVKPSLFQIPYELSNPFSSKIFL